MSSVGPRRRWLAARALLVVVGLCGCTRFDAESEHIRVALVGDNPVPLCAGDLPFFERHIDTVSAHLGVSFDHTVDVELRNDSVTEGGRYRRRGRKITASRSQLGHELVHAVAHDLGNPKLWYTEGAAVAYSGDMVPFPVTGVALPHEEAPRSDFDEYAASGHFFRWVDATYGVDAAVDLLCGESFGASTGVSLEQAEQRWLAESPWAYARLDDCAFPALGRDGENNWHETIALACDDPDVTTSAQFGEGRRHACRVFEIEQAGFYEIAASGVASVRVCFGDPLAEPLAYNDTSLGSIRPLISVPYPILPDAPPRFIEPGRYAVCVEESMDDPEGSVTVDIVPTATTGVRP